MQTIKTHQQFFSFRFSEDSNQMFTYIFNNFKKGIFVQIKNKKVTHFLNLNNEDYKNSWHSNINFEEFKFSADTQSPEKWYANNYLVRYEKPFAESSIGRLELLDMFTELCESVDLGKETLEFFINRRDFPLFRRDEMHPYAAVFGLNKPLKAPKCAAKLFSMVSSPDFLDIPIPTPDDWVRVSGKDFSQTKRTKSSLFIDDFSLPWKQKKNIAVFRGGATGRNFGEKRIQLCSKVLDDPRFDAKITSEATRVQIVDFAVRHPPKIEKKLLGNFLSLRDQSEYKFIIHVEGHVQAYRLSSELATRSVLLIVEGDTKLWYEHKLVAWTHFIPVSRDMSDLKEKLEWALANDEKCEKIALNARIFYDQCLNKRSCLEYLSEVLAPKKRQGIDSPILGESRSYLKSICLKLTDETAAGKNIIVARTDTFSARITNDGRAIRRQFKTFARAVKEREISKWTNKLVQEIPNFLYTFPARTDSLEIVQDFFGSFLSLEQYIRSQAFRFSVLLNILKQIFLALEHARVRCFFVHKNLSPENILLYRTFPRDYDYISLEKEKFQVWRVRVDNFIPVLFDYSEANVFKRDQSNDAARILSTSLFLCLKHRKLSSAQIQLVFDQFGDIFAAKNGKEMVGKIYGGFVPSATIETMDLFERIKDNNFSKVDGVKFTNFGKVSSVYSYPSQDLALFKRYHQQLLSRMTQGGHSEPIIRALEPAKNICDGWKIGETYSDEKYNESLNICIDLLVDDSEFRLDEEEKKELLDKIGHSLRVRYK